jgi:hypothetical protein
LLLNRYRASPPWIAVNSQRRSNSCRAV